MTEISSIN